MEYSIPETAQHIIGDLNQDGYEIYKNDNTAIIQDDNEVWEEDWSDDFYRGLKYDEYKGWIINWEEK